MASIFGNLCNLALIICLLNRELMPQGIYLTKQFIIFLNGQCLELLQLRSRLLRLIV